MSLLSESILKDVVLKKLIDDEKTSRLENETAQNHKICLQILETLYSRKDFENFLKLFEYLTQRRSQSRESIIKMVKYCLETVLKNLPDEESVKKLLECIIKVTDGKIFVELQYSQAVRKMAEIHLNHQDYCSAAKLIQDVQIEAFGSLERDYKVEYILFQMDVLIKNNDYIRTLIVSNKIHRKNLDDKGFELLKTQFYQLLIKYYLHEKKYLDVSKYFKVLYDYVKEVNEKLAKVEKQEINEEPRILEHLITIKRDNSLQTLFQNYVLFLSICPPELETVNMFNELKISYKKELDSDKYIRDLVHQRLSDEILSINDAYFNPYLSYDIFKSDATLLTLFRKYTIQHNISLFEKFFSKIHLKRIAQLINVPENEVEQEIADMVVHNFIYAKINRLEGIVNFKKSTDYHDIIDDINCDLSSMLKNLEQTCHLINKEYLKYKIEN